ncbi:SRPBCC family protein [Nocardia higoensis]|uniref:SRPBCC family protein n=1 Tax=Nocardia higoensis TaxID=228599 RepID=UPI0002E55DD2|nr:SRPBCC family protein [Nocardia higoensis]
MPFSTLGSLLHRSKEDLGEPGEIVVTVPASAEEIFDVLAEGWWYGLWVVGASHIRDVDAQWPAVGSRIHHGVGPWPVTLHDTTEVIAVERPNHLELRARSWPFGSAWVRLELRPAGEGRTDIAMAERVSGGPARMLPGGLQDAMLAPRNRESLRRLADIVVGRRADGRHEDVGEPQGPR